mmetsp:Transcript_28794/g.49791  ORF Transcript_28794/g.49791 Transcript_28794/m.49791 type:complete len:158 (+) Transcript_28794:53-526(+)
MNNSTCSKYSNVQSTYYYSNHSKVVLKVFFFNRCTPLSNSSTYKGNFLLEDNCLRTHMDEKVKWVEVATVTISNICQLNANMSGEKERSVEWPAKPQPNWNMQATTFHSANKSSSFSFEQSSPSFHNSYITTTCRVHKISINTSAFHQSCPRVSYPA